MPAREWLMASVCRAVDRRRGCGSGRAVAGFESQRARSLPAEPEARGGRVALSPKVARQGGDARTSRPRALLPLRCWDLNDCQQLS